MNEKSKIKELLYEKCLEYVNNRISNAKGAMRSAQEAANEELKSSAGDKYNTERALMQIEREKHARQLAEAQKLVKTIDLIDIKKHYDRTDLGSLIETNIGNYFLSISVGKIDIEDFSAFAISPASPLGQQLLGKKEGDEIQFNGKAIHITRIS